MEEQQQRSSSESDVAYMRDHRLAILIDSMLHRVVSVQHPRPWEFIGRLPIFIQPPPPSVNTSTEEPSGCLVPDSLLDSLEDFDAFDIDIESEAAVSLVVRIFERHNVLKDYNIPEPRLRLWVRTVRANYRPASTPAQQQCTTTTTTTAAAEVDDDTTLSLLKDGPEDVPFHNFRHALNVLQLLHVYLTNLHRTCSSDPPLLADRVDIFAMLVAALCHDLQHPGRDNGFLTRTGHPIALRYNDRAVLEQHHCATTFALLEDPAIDLCAEFRYAAAAANPTPSHRQKVFSPAYRRFRDGVVRCILGTEVVAHKAHVQALRDAHAELTTTIAATPNVDYHGRKQALQDKADALDRVLMVCLVEAADIGNEVRATAVARKWALVVESEFCRQGDTEVVLGLVASPSDLPAMRDRNRVVTAKEQCGFIEFLCLPLFRALVDTAGSATFQPCVDRLMANRDAWKATMGGVV